MEKTVMTPLQHLQEERSLYSLDIELNAKAAYETPAVVKILQDSVDPSAEKACETDIVIKATDNIER